MFQDKGVIKEKNAFLIQQITQMDYKADHEKNLDLYFLMDSSNKFLEFQIVRDQPQISFDDAMNPGLFVLVVLYPFVNLM